MTPFAIRYSLFAASPERVARDVRAVGGESEGSLLAFAES
jgi:hypothetical protein